MESRLVPATLTVNTTADVVNPSDGTLSLRDAISAINAGNANSLTVGEKGQVAGTFGANDTIQFSLSSGPQTITLSGGALFISNSLTINGPAANNLTISGNNADRVFQIGQGATVTLDDLTVTGGNSSYGGGLLNSGSLTVNNSTFGGNVAGTGGGGGIYNQGALTLNGCTFTNNTANGYGGGLRSAGPSTLAVNNCLFTNNTTTGNYSYGGGLIDSSTAACVVSNSTFSGNKATGSGGGLFDDTGAGPLTVQNCTFSNNSSNADGGGMDSDAASLTVIGSTFSGNTAASDGGGLQNWQGTLSLRDSTFYGNTALSGGGIMIAGPAQVVNCTLTANRVSGTQNGGGIDVYSNATGQVFNTVVIGNYQGASGTTPNDIAGTLDASSGYNLIGTGGSGGLVNGVNGNQVGVSNPGLGSLSNNGGPTQTVALLAGSPAIDSGSNTYVAAGETDQRGDTRIVNGTVDIGAFEVQAASSFRVTGFPSSVTAGTSGSFTVTALDAFGNVVTNYSGSVHFSSSDGQAILPANYTFSASDRGVHTFSATFKTAGSQFLTVTDTATGAIHGSQTSITVNPSASSSLRVTGFPSSVTAGTAGSFTVTALDAFGNVITNYSGTVHFSSSDGQAILPASYTFSASDRGVHTFSATFKTAGSQSLTVAASGVSSGSQTGIAVNPAAASSLRVTGFPSSVTAGTAGSFTVTALDAFGNVASGYTGAVHFSSSDGQAILPANYTFSASDRGVHTFSATFKTAGSQSFTVADTATGAIHGSQTGITVNPAAANSAILTVNTVSDQTTDTSHLSLRQALAVVDSGSTNGLSNAQLAQITGTLGSNDIIQFSLPSGPQTITLTGGALDITHPVTINGPGAGNLTISGNNTDRVFLIGQIWSPDSSLVVNISGLTLSNGSAVSGSNDYGGGLLNFGTLTLSNCTFADNRAGADGGGGIYNDGALTLNGCTFTSNTAAGYGGGLRSDGASTLAVNNCLFTNNTTTGNYSYGGGLIDSSTAACVVSNSTFSGNSATGGGGGLFFDTDAGPLTVHGCTFSGNNSAADGGGLDADGASLTVTESTFSGNSAAADGGGLQNWQGTLSLRDSTFYGNTAGLGGGGVMIAGPAQVVNCTITANRVSGTQSGGGIDVYSNATAQMFNTVVAGNYQGASGTTPNDIVGTLDASSGYNLIGTGGSGGLVNGVNGNQVGVSNPGLGTLADNGGLTQTVALLAGSPAIDSGSNTYVAAGETDQRGDTRIVNGTVDIGAFEV